MKYEPVRPKAGHVVAAAAWRWDAGRQRYRLQQVAYAPRKHQQEGGRPPRRRGALAAERQDRLL